MSIARNASHPPLSDRVGWLRILLVVVFAALICARMPNVILYGRLWAEEGRLFYVNAATLPWPRALTWSYGGYLNLVANTAPIIGRLFVGLEYIPWFTTGVSLLFQCCPAILLVSSRDDWLRPTWAVIAALLLIVTAPVVEEVWLQTLHSQFHLALCCALILALSPAKGRLAVFGWAVLLLAPLCGPSAWFLLPLFGLRTLIDRSRPRAIQTAFLGLGTAIQIGLFYSHHPARVYGIGPVVLLCVVYVKQLVVPFAGRNVGLQVSGAVTSTLALSRFPWVPLLSVAAAFAAYAVAVARRNHPAGTWMFLASIPICALGYFGALDGGTRLLMIGYEHRYTFIPQILTAMTVLVIATGRRNPDIWIARGIVVWLLAVGIGDFNARWPLVKSGPHWLAEVAHWRRDHAYQIVLWPPGWMMTLPKE